MKDETMKEDHSMIVNFLNVKESGEIQHRMVFSDGRVDNHDQMNGNEWQLSAEHQSMYKSCCCFRSLSQELSPKLYGNFHRCSSLQRLAFRFFSHCLMHWPLSACLQEGQTCVVSPFDAPYLLTSSGIEKPKTHNSSLPTLKSTHRPHQNHKSLDMSHDTPDAVHVLPLCNSGFLGFCSRTDWAASCDGGGGGGGEISFCTSVGVGKSNIACVLSSKSRSMEER